MTPFWPSPDACVNPDYVVSVGCAGRSHSDTTLCVTDVTGRVWPVIDPRYDTVEKIVAALWGKRL